MPSPERRPTENDETTTLGLRPATKMENASLDKLRGIVVLDPAKGKSAKAKSAFTSQFKRLNANATAQFEFAREAAIIGVSDAINEVVRCYQEGVGTEPDRVKAFEWIRKAATIDDDVKFAFDLARCYRDGDGTDRDVEKFWTWMKRAADTGDTEAMFQLAKACLDPKLGTPSSERADEWTIKMAEKRSRVRWSRSHACTTEALRSKEIRKSF